MKGYYTREERLMQRDWEVARWQIMHFVSPYSKKKMIKSADIAVFEWEREKSKIEIPDRAEVLDRIEQLQRWEDKHK